MPTAQRPLIVGAGPVGLAAALFLKREGFNPRLVETRTEPAPQSKALAVNPRILDLLEPTGVTARMLELGSPVRGWVDALKQIVSSRPVSEQRKLWSGNAIRFYDLKV